MKQGRRSLISVTYLAADNAGDGTENGDENEADTTYGTGRHWGVFNRKKLPRAEQQTIRIPAGPWLKAFRNDAGTIYPPAADENGFGFTLFVENAAEWLGRASMFEQGMRRDSPGKAKRQDTVRTILPKSPVDHPETDRRDFANVAAVLY